MIQRIQSLYLLLGATACAIPLLVGLAPVETGTPEWTNTLRSALPVLAALTGFGAIFMYRTRDRQSLVVVVAQALAAVGLIVAVGALILYGAAGPGVRAITASTGGVVSVAGPLAAIVLFQLARRGIAADIRLLKSMDRLRD